MPAETGMASTSDGPNGSRDDPGSTGTQPKARNGTTGREHEMRIGNQETLRDSEDERNEITETNTENDWNRIANRERAQQKKDEKKRKEEEATKEREQKKKESEEWQEIRKRKPGMRFSEFELDAMRMGLRPKEYDTKWELIEERTRARENWRCER